MKFTSFILSIFLSLNALADRPIQSARMGKVGSIHPNAWRISESPDIKGAGKNYIFKISLYKGSECIDSFDFELNKGAKNTKKSQFSLKGDMPSEKFGNELSLEILDIKLDKEEIHAKLELKSKVLKSIIYKDKKYIGNFTSIQIDKKIDLNPSSILKICLDKKEDIYAEVKTQANDR